MIMEIISYMKNLSKVSYKTFPNPPSHPKERSVNRQIFFNITRSTGAIEYGQLQEKYKLFPILHQLGTIFTC